MSDGLAGFLGAGILFLFWYSASRRKRWDRQQAMLHRLERIEQALAVLKAER